MNLVGQRIGSYIVDRELGAGGTGTVYLCKHTLIDRDVAVKVLHDDQARDPDQVARFFQEAKAAAEIGHPNIIVIIDFGTLHTDSGDRAWLMMESLEGISLDKKLHKGGLTLAEIHHVMSQCCSALTASHSKGIIHRDLKPANVFLCNRSFDPIFVKVLDFGIAKLTTPAPGVRKTQYGIVIGTPAYMSPEQCEGKGAIDHRSDIYSLGCMLYEMLTGTLPYPGEVGQMLLGHLHQPLQPPRLRNPAVPPEWEALCLHMMEKSKERRPQSMVEVARALDNLRGHAAAYQVAAAAREHSGHTQVMPAEDGLGGVSAAARETLHVDLSTLPAVAPAPAPAPAPPPPTAAPAEETMPASQLGVALTMPATPADVAAARQPAAELSAFSSGPYVAVPPEQWPLGTDQRETVPPPPTDPYAAACAALVTDPRNVQFLATLLVRPPGRWSAVVELCQTSGTAAPPTLPHPPLFVTWLDHPYLDPSMCAVFFLALRDGWSAAFLCPRRTW